MKPNMHHVILDALKILKAAVAKASASPVEVLSDIIDFNKYLVLGICHKLLRVLEPIHYAAAFLNPGIGHVPDFNNFIPYGEE